MATDTKADPKATEKKTELAPYSLGALVQAEDGTLFRVRGFAAFDHNVDRPRATAIAQQALEDPPPPPAPAPKHFVYYFYEVRAVTSDKDPWKEAKPPATEDPMDAVRKAAIEQGKTNPTIPIAPLQAVVLTKEQSKIVWGN